MANATGTPNSATQWPVITPSDTAGLGYTTRGIWVGGAGTINALDASGNFRPITVGTGMCPIITTWVKATGTSATLLNGML